MQRNIFSPRVPEAADDVLSAFFYRLSQGIVLIVFALLPLFFLPGFYVSLGFTKVMFVAVGLYLAILFACLSVLRSGRVQISIPLPIILFWGFSVLAIASSLLSGDTYDSLYGMSLDTQTAGFFVLLALVMSVSLVFRGANQAVVKLLLLGGGTAILVSIYSIARIIFGADFLSFGIFNTNSSTLVGSFNDLALYAGLVLIITLIVAHKLSDKIVPKVLATILAAGALFILAVVNFSFVWLTVGFISLLSFLYLVSKDTWLKRPEAIDEPEVSRFTLILVGFMCVVSGAFIISGDTLGVKVAELTNISYVEVRPSFEATIDIAKQVLKENALFGLGPNRFEDAWRLYKDPVINSTQFWSTTFNSGNSFAATLMITTGIAGMFLFLAFIFSFLYLGYRLAFLGTTHSAGWQMLGRVTFAAATYIWLMSFLYTPGTTIMLMAAIMTGLTMALSLSTKPDKGTIFDAVQSRQHGFLLIAAVLVIIVGSTTLGIGLYKQVNAQSAFADAVRELGSTQNVFAYDSAVGNVMTNNGKQDVYPAERARVRLLELNRLIAITEPSNEEQERFQAVLLEGIDFAKLAISLDQTNPVNYALLGSFYGFINTAQYEGVAGMRDAAFASAKALDPHNPEYLTIQAQLSTRFGELDKAKEYLGEAIGLKNNYTDALFLLSQINIQEGNATSAIAATRAIISLEPYNPGRYFQLGLLLVATGNQSEAISSFEVAISLDANYANARYMLALSYLETGRTEDALNQLKQVQVSNQDNETLASLISQIEEGSYINQPLGLEAPVREGSATFTQDEATVTTGRPGTDLVTPVNRVPGENSTPTEDKPAKPETIN